ncbi:MAG: vanadium-dependent haloperoxidase [Deltaproteobacteria bacterium]|nr:MAG: vanadium-dependent haloperoxidase [Deltaproteobacteria bacterium]
MLSVALLCASLSFQGTGSAHASNDASQPDQVIQWNRTLLQILQTPGAQPATVHPTRSMAIVHLAIYDAVNAIRGGHAPYLVVHAPRSASPDAAAAAAAHTALLSLFPTQQSMIDAKFQDSLSQIGGGAHVRQGIRVGKKAANAILAARANDRSDSTPPVFMPQSGPGEYQLTPPNFKQPVFTNWSDVRAASRIYAGQHFRYDEDAGRALGEINSTTRSADQTDIGRFWGAAPVQNVWNQIAQTAGVSFANSLEQNARMFALLDTSLADGVIALYDSKYAYHRWRPVTAVQAADNDGNPDTTGDPNWTPLAVTALDPSYAGAHAEISQSAATTLRDFFGTDRLDFSLTNPSLPGIVRSFQSFSEAADEAAVSRIYAGQHFRYDEDAGQALGDQVGDFVFDSILRPVAHGR